MNSVIVDATGNLFCTCLPQPLSIIPLDIVNSTKLYRGKVNASLCRSC